MFRIIEKQNTYQIVSYLTAALYFYLFVMLLFFPGSFLNDIGIKTTESAEFLARRAAMLMLGFAVLVFFGRKMYHSPARQVMALAISVNMAGFALMGLFEFGRGFVNAGILTAVTIESILAVSYFLFWFAARRAESLENANPEKKS
jgi:hypothetical protein